MKKANTICGTIVVEGKSIIEKVGNKVTCFVFPSESSAIAYYDQRRIRAKRGAKVRRMYNVEYSFVK